MISKEWPLFGWFWLFATCCNVELILNVLIRAKRLKYTKKKIKLQTLEILLSVKFQFIHSLSQCPTLCDPMDCSMPGFPVQHQLPELTNSCSVMPPNHLMLCRPHLASSIFPKIRVFSNESALHIRWPKYWSFSFSISPSSEHPGLISFRMNWVDLLAVQGTLKSLLQHHSSKASIRQCSAFFIV